MNMTDEQYDAWLAALNSGKYKQVQHVLYSESENGYCCMGVAGVVCFGVPPVRMKTHSYLSALRDSFADAEEILLGDLNDGFRLTFPEIAMLVAAGGLDMILADERPASKIALDLP